MMLLRQYLDSPVIARDFLFAVESAVIMPTTRNAQCPGGGEDRGKGRQHGEGESEPSLRESLQHSNGPNYGVKI